MDFSSSLARHSRWRVYRLYILFVFAIMFGCYLFYTSGFQYILEHPDIYTAQYFRYQYKHMPVTFVLFVVIYCLFACSLMCAIFIAINLLVTSIWIYLKPYWPVRFRRRTICFCKRARRRLSKILRSVHDTQCTWNPTHFNNLDDVTKKCILLVADETHKTINCEALDPTLVGSSAEGLGKSYVIDLENSYRDQWGRFLLRFFCCCLPCNTSFTSLRTDIDVIMKYTEKNVQTSTFKLDILSNDKPGFVRILINPEKSKEFANPWTQFCKDDTTGQCFLSSTLIRNAVFRSVDSIDENVLPASRIFGPYKHPPVIEIESIGPAIKLKMYPVGQVWYWNENQTFVIFEADFVFGIHCHHKWPSCAQRWSSRPRYWPSPNDVKYVEHSGYILVAKSSKTLSSEENEMEWLVSFPHCETYLGQRIPQVAKACYLALKIMFKDHLSYVCENLKTYQLKTLLFWELEKHPIEYWDIRNVEQCFMCLLDSFIECVATQQCPSYWIENHNLFVDCDSRELVQLSVFLREVRANPAPYIEDVGSLWC